MNKLRRLKISALLGLALACLQGNVFGAFDENSLQYRAQETQPYIYELRAAAEEARRATEEARRAAQEARNILVDLRNSAHDALHNINAARIDAITEINSIRAMGR